MRLAARAAAAGRLTATTASSFTMADEGKGLVGIADCLNREGIPSPGGGAWSKHQIHYALRNQAYIGVRLYNKHSFHDRSGQIRRGGLKPKDDWVRCEDAHQPIVPKELFFSVQAKLKSRPFAHGSGNLRKPWILSGLVYCKHCGHRFQGWTKKGKGYTHEYYVCGGYVLKGRSVCESVHVPREELEGFIIRNIQERVSNPAWLKGLKSMLAELVEAEFSNKPTETLGEVQRALIRNRQQVDNLLDALKNGVLSPFVRQELDRLEAERTKLLEQRESLSRQQSAKMETDVILDEMLRFLGEFDKVILNGTPEQRKAFLRAFLYKTEITHKDGLQATHYFHKVPRPENEITEGRMPSLALTFGDPYLTNMVAGAGFEPATSRL